MARTLRADARRNRSRVLEAAIAAFAAEGLSVPVHEIARRAGVGTGTVSRHFPTKESLFEAIVGSIGERLVALARELADTEEPGTALFEFLAAMVEEGAANRALSDVFAGAGFDVEAAAQGSDHDVLGALGELLASAQRAGAVRSDGAGERERGADHPGAAHPHCAAGTAGGASRHRNYRQRRIKATEPCTPRIRYVRIPLTLPRRAPFLPAKMGTRRGPLVGPLRGPTPQGGRDCGKAPIRKSALEPWGNVRLFRGVFETIVYSADSTQLFNALFGAAPTLVETGLPSLNRISVGMPRTA